MAMLDMLQLPDGSYGLPPQAPIVDPFTGRDIAAERVRRSIRRPAPGAIDPGPLDSGASPVPGMLGGLPIGGPGDAANFAPPAPAPSMAQPASPSAPQAPEAPFWPGMLAVPNPRPGASTDSAALPPAAAPASGAVPASVAPLAAAASSGNVPPTSMLGRIGDMLNNRSSTMLALGAGLMGSQNLGQGLSRGFAAAVPAQQADIKLQQQNQTVAALIKRGVPQDVALSAAANPAIMAQILPQIFGAKQRQFTQIGEDVFGGKQYGFVDPVANKVYDLSGKEVTGGGAGEAGGSEFLAKGVSQIDHSLKGPEYLAQFSPEVQAAAKAYMNGEAMPTGNPRKGFVQTVKMIAQKAGADMGTPVDDNTYAAKHKMMTGLASTAPGGIGGQVTYARTSLNHLADVGEAAVDLNNSSGVGIAPLAHLFNSARGLTTEQSAKVKALGDKAAHYGQEITKYYAGSPGGESERTAFLQSLGGANAPEELAAVLQSELELARGKITKTQATIDETMGPGSRHQVMMPAEQKDIQRTEAAIARLKGLAPPGEAQTPPARPAAPAAGAPKPGNYQWTPDRGLVLVQ